MDITVNHDEKKHIFYNVTDGKESVLRYKQIEPTVLEYYSTFVPPELRGQQLGEKIVTYALDYARDHDLKIIPTCPFVKRIIERNPQYQKLIK